MMRIAGRLLAGVIVLATIAPVLAADRTADEIKKELKGLKAPSAARINVLQGAARNTAIQEYLAARKEYTEKQAELIGELAKVAPEDAELTKLMPQRWMGMIQGGKMAEAEKEIDHAASANNQALKVEALYLKAQLAMRQGGAAAQAAIDAFTKAAPKDSRGALFLYRDLQNLEGEKKTAMEERIVKEFPDSPYAGMILGERKQREAIGKPFELEFTDAIKDSQVSIKGLKGKVVVIDFWATWCGPCVAEMPNMKKLYAEYKDKGVEFIGVSLDQPKDQGGLDALKKFVAENDIQWPQYYQGDYWNSAFSKGWGINAIPCVFVVDQDGNLYSVDARGKLDKMIPELLKKKGGAGAGE